MSRSSYIQFFDTTDRSFEPDALDLKAAALLHALISDFARGNGVMPPSWQWPPVSSSDMPTLVVALPASEWPWPGGGVRVESGWRSAQCAAIGAAGLTEQYW